MNVRSASFIQRFASPCSEVSQMIHGNMFDMIRLLRDLSLLKHTFSNGEIECITPIPSPGRDTRVRDSDRTYTRLIKNAAELYLREE